MNLDSEHPSSREILDYETLEEDRKGSPGVLQTEGIT